MIHRPCVVQEFASGGARCSLRPRTSFAHGRCGEAGCRRDYATRWEGPHEGAGALMAVVAPGQAGKRTDGGAVSRLEDGMNEIKRVGLTLASKSTRNNPMGCIQGMDGA